MAQAQSLTVNEASGNQPALQMIDLAKFAATPLAREPYDYIIVPGFIRESQFDQIVSDYPVIQKKGSFPLSTLKYKAAFAQLLEELKSSEFQAAVEKKFNVDLAGRPTMFTIRGMCGEGDGKIHTDTESKILSLLLYMNPSWEKDGGRLRLLNSKNIDDVGTEIPPSAGTLLIFRRAKNSWHGHKPYAGPRKVIQMNWVTEQRFVDKNLRRHGFSAFIKKLNPFSKSEY